jgi:hypothetical protein
VGNQFEFVTTSDRGQAHFGFNASHRKLRTNFARENIGKFARQIAHFRTRIVEFHACEGSAKRLGAGSGQNQRNGPRVVAEKTDDGDAVPGTGRGFLNSAYV